MKQALTDILRHPAIWRVGHLPTSTSLKPCIPTGFPALDQALPAHGWEQGTMSEILANHYGIGELSLLTPALRQTTLLGKNVVLAAPPYLPFPNAWESSGILLNRIALVRAEGADLLWAIEQAARSSCAMVVAWTTSCRKELSYQALRRLHMAADAGGSTLILFRPECVSDQASPAPTRIAVTSSQGELNLHIVKRRGALLGEIIRINVFPEHWKRHTIEHAFVTLANRRDPSQESGAMIPAPKSPPRQISASS